jgi:DNA (cytosine-5)-methyltransferase 1
MTDADLDHYLSWDLAIACLRVEKESGQKLSPKEMIERVEGEKSSVAMPLRGPGARASHGAASASPPDGFAPYRVLDLFSGIGGFSLGLERTGGFRTVAFCEIDPFCQRVLAKHWPAVPCYDDIRELTAERLAADGISVDVLCGGFPCQDISCAGPRVGIDGERSGLWSQYARLIGEIRPRYVIVENTDDLAIRGLGRVLGDLAEIGYDAEWHCIPAAAAGADHWRDRLWIIAHPNGAGCLQVHERGREQCSAQVGEDAPHDHGTRLQGRLQAGTIAEDARAFGPWLGLALNTAPAFPGLDGAGSPVLGRGENGIPDRVDRMHAIGNAVVPQIPELIGRAILAQAVEPASAVSPLRASPSSSVIPTLDG